MNLNSIVTAIDPKGKFLIEDVLASIKKALNVNEIEERDSSYYLNDTYFSVNLGYSKVKVFYTVAQINGNVNKVYIIVSIGSNELSISASNEVAGFLFGMLSKEYELVYDGNMWPNIDDFSHEVLKGYLDSISNTRP